MTRQRQLPILDQFGGLTGLAPAALESPRPRPLDRRDTWVVRCMADMPASSIDWGNDTVRLLISFLSSPAPHESQLY